MKVWTCRGPVRISTVSKQFALVALCGKTALFQGARSSHCNRHIGVPILGFPMARASWPAPSPELAETAARAEEAHSRLEQHYGAVEPARRAAPLDELVGTILSQNTSDLNSERAFDSLLSAFGSWEAVCAADVRAIAEAIKIGGLAQVKAPRIKAVLEQLESRTGE